MIPFLERDGDYWGPPPDDRTAIAEVERLRAEGAERLLLASESFWWLVHYPSFARYLRSNFRCLAEGGRVMAFDMTETMRGPPAVRRRLGTLKRRCGRYARRVLKAGEDGSVHWARAVMDRETRGLVEAVDYRSFDAIEISGRKWESFGFASYRSVGFPDYDVCTEPLEESRFDIVIAEQVLEHVLWPTRAVANVWRMLAPGGVFLVTTPFLVRVHDHPVDCSRWTETGMRYLLAEGGFDLDGITTGSWGNRACVRANFDRWVEWVPWRHSLRNDPNFPVVVWALATKPRVA